VKGIPGVRLPDFHHFKLREPLCEHFPVIDAFMISNGLFGARAFVFGGKVLGVEEQSGEKQEEGHREGSRHFGLNCCKSIVLAVFQRFRV
jgi:hypothetical protein